MRNHCIKRPQESDAEGRKVSFVMVRQNKKVSIARLLELMDEEVKYLQKEVRRDIVNGVNSRERMDYDVVAISSRGSLNEVL